MSIETSLEADTQFAKTSKPCMGAFDNPVMAAELFAALDTTAGDARDGAPPCQRLPAMRIVIPLVRIHFVRVLPWPSGHTRYWWYRIEHCLEYFRVVPVGTCDHECQRNALTVHRDMAFATDLAPVSRGRPGLLTPRGWPRSRHRYSHNSSQLHRIRAGAQVTPCRRAYTPLFCQSRSRRQHVMPLPNPSSCGKSSHGMSVCSTNNIPFNAVRSSTRGRPPFGEGARSGSNG